MTLQNISPHPSPRFRSRIPRLLPLRNTGRNRSKRISSPFLFLFVLLSAFPSVLCSAEVLPEVRQFLKNLPRDLSQRQIAAMRKAREGDSSALDAIRNARPDTCRKAPPGKRGKPFFISMAAAGFSAAGRPVRGSAGRSARRQRFWSLPWSTDWLRSIPIRRRWRTRCACSRRFVRRSACPSE